MLMVVNELSIDNRWISSLTMPGSRLAGADMGSTSLNYNAHCSLSAVLSAMHYVAIALVLEIAVF